MFGHVVGVGAGKLRGLPVELLYRIDPDGLLLAKEPISYIPLINPTVNQLINQLSYHQSAINPIKSSFLVGKITFFFTGLHLVTITTLPRTATPQMVRANTTDALQLSSVWPQEVLTLMWGWVKLPCTPLN
jgi:hypothetical protein